MDRISSSLFTEGGVVAEGDPAPAVAANAPSLAAIAAAALTLASSALGNAPPGGPGGGGGADGGANGLYAKVGGDSAAYSRSREVIGT